MSWRERPVWVAVFAAGGGVIGVVAGKFTVSWQTGQAIVWEDWLAFLFAAAGGAVGGYWGQSVRLRRQAKREAPSQPLQNS